MTLTPRVSKHPDTRDYGEYLTPVTGIDVLQPEQREEPPDDWDSLIRDVRASRPPDEQRRLLEPHFIRVKREGAHVIHLPRQGLYRNPKLEVAALPDKVCHQELADGHTGLDFGEDRVGFGLLAHVHVLDAAHRADVFAKGGVEVRFGGCVVDGYDAPNQIGIAERDGHGGFGAPVRG